MSNKEFINNLSSTHADVRKLDAKKINLKGKNILDYIKESTPSIKHSQDTRETVTENNLWGQYTETTEDGTIIVHDDWVTNPNGSTAWNTSITKVEDNKAYVGEDLFANIQTEKIKNGDYMFHECGNLNSFSSDLSNLINGDHMFYDTNLSEFSSDLSNLTSGYNMFRGCSNLNSFTSDLSSMKNGEEMFEYCSNLTSFSSNLSNLTSGKMMFYECDNLTSFSSDLPSLINGETMFYKCDNLNSFTIDLSNLMSGYNMFNGCSKLTSFSSDLSKLTNGYQMFISCSNLTSFNTDLSNLTYSRAMFQNCTNLTSFISVLSNLIDGTYMFRYGCLNAESVMYIANTINNITTEKQLYVDGTIPYVTKTNGVYSAPRGFMQTGNYVYTYNNPKPYTTSISASNVGNLTLGINVSNNADTIQQQLEDFAKKAFFESWDKLKTHFSNKGWTVTFQYSGTSTDITLSEDEMFRGVPVYARLIEVTPEGEEYTEEEKESAEYCTEDGTKYYNIDWGHDVTDYDQYQYFGSLLEACGYYGVIPKKYLEV